MIKDRLIKAHSYPNIYVLDDQASNCTKHKHNRNKILTSASIFIIIRYANEDSESIEYLNNTMNLTYWAFIEHGTCQQHICFLQVYQRHLPQ